MERVTWRQKLEAMINKAVSDSLLKLKDQGECGRVFLFYKPTQNGHWGSLHILTVNDEPEEDLERCYPVLTANLTEAQLKERIVKAVNKLPIIGGLY